MEKKTRVLEDAFAARRAILTAVSVLKEKGLSAEGVEELGERLLPFGVAVVPIIMSQFERVEDEDLLVSHAMLINYLNHDEFIAPLTEYVLSPKHADGAKAIALGVLRELQVDPTDPLFGNIFKNPEKSFVHSVEQFLAQDTSSEATQSYFLEEFFFFDAEFKVAAARQLAATGEEKAVSLLRLLALNDDGAVAHEAVAGLGRLPLGSALNALVSLSRQVLSTEITQAVRRAIQRHALCGLRVAGHPPGTAAPARAVTGMVSNLDGEGLRAVWFTRRRTRPDEFETCCLLLSDFTGVKDCYGSRRINRRDYAYMLKRMRQGGSFRRVSRRYGLALLRDALWINAEEGIPLPPEFALHREVLEGVDLTPQRYQSRFTVEDLAGLPRREELLARTADLYELPDFQDWFISTERVYDYAEQYKALAESGPSLKREWEMKRLKARFCEELLAPHRELLCRRLLMTADYFSETGCHAEAVPLVLVAAREMQHAEAPPLVSQPFVERLIAESLELALEGLKDDEDVRFYREEFDGYLDW